MTAIYICDGCKKEISGRNMVRFWGNSELSDVIFCKDCFDSIEKFVIKKFRIRTKNKRIVYEDQRPKAN